MSSDETEIFRDSNFRLYESNGVFYLRQLIISPRESIERYLGSAEIIPFRELTDKQKVYRLLNGDLYRIFTIKPYDPKTDSDAEILGDPCSKTEAVSRLWLNRFNIQG